MKPEVNKFYRDRETKEVYWVRKITEKSVFVDHCVRDISWEYPNTLFKKSFIELTKAEADRAEILTDIVYQLNAKKFFAKRGEYVQVCQPGVSFGKDLINNSNELNSYKELQEIFSNKNCSVCALGAMFVSAVNLHDDLTVGGLRELQSNIDVRGLTETEAYAKKAGAFAFYLSEWFDAEELRLMEFAFENNDIEDYFSIPIHHDIESFKDDYCRKKKHWYNYGTEDHLKEIIANTLVNGKFMPEKGLAP